MRALIGCERSGIIREAFRALGHDAWSCDLEPAEDGSPFHIVGDVLKIANPRKWDLFIVHPDCQFLSVSGYHWNYRRPERMEETEKALAFADACFDLCDQFEMACLENPTSIISTRLRPPSQSIQPYDFGEDASKETWLWLFNLPKLIPTKRIPGRIVIDNGQKIERWANQTDSGQNKLGPSETRWMDRARTYQGIADAMASQWTNPIQKGLFSWAKESR